MENASQALIIAGTILIAMIVLGVGVYLISNYSQIDKSYHEKSVVEEIRKFNTNFTKFVGRTDVTAQEIITLKNFAQNYDSNNGTNTSVQVNNNSITGEDTVFIIEHTPEVESSRDGSKTVRMKYFSCEEGNITYNAEGRVTAINFTPTR